MTVSGRRTPVLGLSERWSLARKLAQTPIVVIFHASLPAGLVDRPQLEQAIHTLLETYPILRHTVVDGRGDNPSYQLDKSVTCEDIVRTLPLSRNADSTALISQANVTGTAFEVGKGSLIRCELHQSTQAGQRDSLVLFFDHIVCDGLGGRNLFSDLLFLLSAQTLVPAPSGLPLRMDDTVDLSPVTSTPQLEPDFPPANPSYDAQTSDQVLTDFTLSAETLQSLLAVSKAHGVKTLHPVLHTAALVAFHRATGTDSPCTIRTSTPISERDESKGHPRSTGNYVIFHYANTLVDSSLPFWEETRRFSTLLRDPSTRLGARSTLRGMGDAAILAARDSQTEGWGSFMDGLISKANGPIRLGVAVSNVGKLDLPLAGKLAGEVRDVYFAQSSSSVGATIVLSVVSCTSGPLAICVASKEGSLPPGVLDTFESVLKDILVEVAADRIEDTSGVS